MHNNIKGTSLAILCMLLLVLTIATAQEAPDEVAILKRVSRTTVNEGDDMNVTLSIRNNMDRKLIATLYDPVPSFAQISGDMVDYYGSDVEASIVLGPGETETIEYYMDFGYIPRALDGKQATLGRAYIIDEPLDNALYISNSIDLTYRSKDKTTQCNFNFECEQDLGESFENCFQDCVMLQYEEEMRDMQDLVRPVETNQTFIIWVLIIIIIILIAAIIANIVRK